MLHASGWWPSCRPRSSSECSAGTTGLSGRERAVIAFDHSLDFAELTALLEAWAAEHPSLVEPSSIGRSYSELPEGGGLRH